MNDERGGRLVAEHLLSRGHRAIVVPGRPERSYSGQLRAKGYRATLEAAGIMPCLQWERHCLPMVESGREEAYYLLTHQPEITAMFCYNDLSAVALCKPAPTWAAGYQMI